ncbi:MAG: hypothetical protein KGL55_02070 [Rhodospirillales bacterium]|nr:hypothetical protein [Rhodospirillales bacterium]
MPAEVPAVRPAPFGRGEALACFAVAVMLLVLEGVATLPAVLAGGLINPDSFMRLDRLLARLAGGAPPDIVPRGASGLGAPITSWSHLLDSLLLLIAAPLRPFMAERPALHAAAIIFGPLGVGLVGAACAWAMAPLAERRWRWTAAALAALASPILSYGLPGVIHHHVLLAFVVVMLAGSAARIVMAEPRAAWRLGGIAAFGIWLSPEAMPFVLMAFGGIALGWVLAAPGDRLGAAAAIAGTVFLALTAAAFAVDPPTVGPPSAGIWVAQIDRISVIYVVLAAFIAAIGWSLFWLDHAAPARRTMLGALLAIGGIVAWMAMFPRVLLGPAALMPAAEARAFFGHINEMMPVDSLPKAVAFLLDGAVAEILLLWFVWRGATLRLSLLWGYASLCLAVMLVLGQSHARFATYAIAMAAAALPVALTEVTRRLAPISAGAEAAGRVGLLAVMLLANRADAFAAMLAGQPADGDKVCPVAGLAPMLAPYAGQVVLSDVNDVPELLYRTGVLTVGSLYHSNVAAFLRLRAAWRTLPAPHEPAAVRATRAAYILTCAGAARSGLVDDLPPDTLEDRLHEGRPPRWLVEVARDAASGNVLYQVRP